jgi:hypothetical protein
MPGIRGFWGKSALHSKTAQAGAQGDTALYSLVKGPPSITKD